MKKLIKFTYIFFQLILFTSLIFPQSPAIKKALEEYEKNMYPWKPLEYEQPVDDTILTVLGRWAWGPCHAVDVKDNYAYIGNGPTFHILDISDPTKPEIVGEFITEGYIYDMKVRDNIAFVAIGRGLLILDVTDPSLPEEISYIAINGIAISLAVDSSFVYLITFTRTMRVVDIFNINAPVLRGIISTQARPISVVAKDGYVYVGNIDTPFLQIIKAENPDSLTYTAFYTGKLGISSYIKDNSLFLGGSWFITHFMIYDITDLSSPQFIGQAEIPDSVFLDGITVSEDGLTGYGLALTSYNPLYKEGIFSIDLTNLNQPTVMDKFEKDDINPSGWRIGISNNKLVAAYFTGALIIDASNPDSLKFNSFFPTGDYAFRISLKDHYAFIASGQAGLWIFDFVNPEKPKAIANLNTGSFTSDVIVEDTIAYIVNWQRSAQPTDNSRGLWIIDISNIYMPKVISHYIGITNYPNFIVSNTIAKSGNLIFLTQARTLNSNDIMEVIDVSNPNEPISLGIFQGNFDPYNITYNNNIVFLATTDGLKIIDIADPINPLEISSILNRASGVSYNYPYVYTSTSEFSIINVNDPVNPFVVSSIQTHTGSNIVDLFVIDNYAYWAEGSLGIIDISNNENPIQITTFQGKHYGRGVVVTNNMIFFADQTQGVWILRNNLITTMQDDDLFIPSTFELYQNYPNPFNISTVIEFSIPKKNRIKIEVFDILGRRIETLFDNEMKEGKHSITFNASNLSSGIYLYKLTTNSTTIIRKMVVLK